MTYRLVAGLVAGAVWFGLLATDGCPRAEEVPRPTILYADTRALPGRPASGDVVVERERDGAHHRFDFLPNGERDRRGIIRFLGSSLGRVVTVFDQAGHRDLGVPATAMGPIMDTADRLYGGTGLMFDNGGAFEGNPNAYGRPNYAVALRADTRSVDLHHGVTLVLRLRVAHEASITGGELLALGPDRPYGLTLFSGNPDPGRAAGSALDMTMAYARFTTLAPALPSTVSTFGLAVDEHGFTAGTTDGLRSVDQPFAGNVVWHELRLGTMTPGGGDGWEVASLALFDRRLTADQLTRVMRAASAEDARKDGPDIVLDGSSVEAGVGSTALRNLTRLYEQAFPNATIYNVAVGGATSADRLAALPSTLSVLAHDGNRSVLICGAGANSLARGVSAAEVHRQMREYVLRARSHVTGLLVGVTTIIPLRIGIDAGFADEFSAYNALLRQDQAGADFLIDRAADPIMGNPKTVTPHVDRRYSTDGAHPTDLGYGRLAAIDIASIRSALATRQRPRPQGIVADRLH